ncbi:hypothetical protein HK405_015540, partial [Cladochytrium tenue]
MAANNGWLQTIPGIQGLTPQGLQELLRLRPDLIQGLQMQAQQSAGLLQPQPQPLQPPPLPLQQQQQPPAFHPVLTAYPPTLMAQGYPHAMSAAPLERPTAPVSGGGDTKAVGVAKRITPVERKRLEQAFVAGQYSDAHQQALCQELGLTGVQVKKWFKRRVAREQANPAAATG